jgi:hypothetical protein
MRRFCFGVAGLLLLPAPLLADGLPAAALAEGRGSGCANAYSFGEIAAPDDPRGGPVIVVPDTLCPDLVGGHATSIQSLSIYVDGRREGAVQHPAMRLPKQYKAPVPRY